MKKSFQKLVQIKTGAEDEEKYTAMPVSRTLKYLENFVQILFKGYLTHSIWILTHFMWNV